MALLTLGTNANNSLSALKFHQSADVMSDSDLAAFNALVKSDSGNSGQLNTYVSRDGQLWIPRRGFIKVANNDYLAVDSTTGWPIVLSAAAIASGPYTHS